MTAPPVAVKIPAPRAPRTPAPVWTPQGTPDRGAGAKRGLVSVARSDRAAANRAAVVWFLTFEGRADRILEAHTRQPDGGCAGCYPARVEWPCTLHELASRAAAKPPTGPPPRTPRSVWLSPNPPPFKTVAGCLGRQRAWEQQVIADYRAKQREAS